MTDRKVINSSSRIIGTIAGIEPVTFRMEYSKNIMVLRATRAPKLLSTYLTTGTLKPFFRYYSGF